MASINPQTRLAVYKEGNGKCIYCDSKIGWETFTVDHVKAKTKGGKDRIENYACSCMDCNQIKGNMSVEEFDSFLDSLHIMLRSNQQFRVFVKHFKVNISRKTSFVEKCRAKYK